MCVCVIMLVIVCVSIMLFELCLMWCVVDVFVLCLSCMCCHRTLLVMIVHWLLCVNIVLTSQSSFVGRRLFSDVFIMCVWCVVIMCVVLLCVSVSLICWMINGVCCCYGCVWVCILLHVCPCLFCNVFNVIVVSICLILFCVLISLWCVFCVPCVFSRCRHEIWKWDRWCVPFDVCFVCYIYSSDVIVRCVALALHFVCVCSDTFVNGLCVCIVLVCVCDVNEIMSVGDISMCKLHVLCYVLLFTWFVVVLGLCIVRVSCWCDLLFCIMCDVILCVLGFCAVRLVLLYL